MPVPIPTRLASILVANLLGLEEDYREMLLGEVAAKLDPVRWFTESGKAEKSRTLPWTAG
jgi:hypothetical protein